MAKGLPYFKFTPTEWITGDINFESFELQGLFISICALYWQRDGEVNIEDLNKRFKREDLITELSDRFFSVNDGFISIKFLDEQLKERGHVSMVNSENGKLGGRPKSVLPLEEKPTALVSVSEPKAKKSQEEEEQEKEVEKNKKKKKELEFLKFWNLYDKKVDSKKCQDKFNLLTELEINKIFEVVENYVKSKPDKQYRKNPLTWLNGKCWNDDIILPQLQNGTNNASQKPIITEPLLGRNRKDDES